jgi:hypothetical protein
MSVPCQIGSSPLSQKNILILTNNTDGRNKQYQKQQYNTEQQQQQQQQQQMVVNPAVAFPTRTTLMGVDLLFTKYHNMNKMIFAKGSSGW